VASVAVSGAGGFIGSRLVRRFSERGWRVVALVRDPAAALPALAGVEYVRYDLRDEPPAAALAGMSCLVHAAYVKGDVDVNLEGSRRLLAAADTQGVGYAIFLSSLAADPGASAAYGRQKDAIERLLRPERDTALRPGLVIGDGGLLRETVRFMRRWHVVPVIGGGRHPLQTVGVDDLVAAVERLVASPLAGTYTIADPRPTTYRDVYRAIARELRLRVLFVPLPFWLVLLAIRAARLVRLPLGVTEDNLRGLRRARHVDSSADLERLGIALRPLEATLRDQR
jgi:NADH dehydrogenase